MPRGRPPSARKLRAITIRIPEELYNKLQQLSEQRAISIGTVLRLIVQAYLENNETISELLLGREKACR